MRHRVAKDLVRVLIWLSCPVMSVEDVGIRLIAILSPSESRLSCLYSLIAHWYANLVAIVQMIPGKPIAEFVVRLLILLVSLTTVTLLLCLHLRVRRNVWRQIILNVQRGSHLIIRCLSWMILIYQSIRAILCLFNTYAASILYSVTEFWLQSDLCVRDLPRSRSIRVLSSSS